MLASNLGVLLEQQGDYRCAEQPFRRAAERGHATAAFNLGGLLAEHGDLDGAAEAYRQADDQGDADAAANLGMVLGELKAAAAYRRTERGGTATQPRWLTPRSTS